MSSAPTAFPDFSCRIYFSILFRDVNLVFSVLELLILFPYSLFILGDKFRVLIFFDIKLVPKLFLECVKWDIAHLSFIDCSFRSANFVPELPCSLTGQYSTVFESFPMIGVDYRVHCAATSRVIFLSGRAVALVGLAVLRSSELLPYVEEEPSHVSCHGAARRPPMYSTLGFAARCH